MVTIRLTRGGKKNDPFYRIVAIDKADKLSGKALAILGHWYPKKDTKVLDKKAIDAWVQKGARVSDAVKNLMK
ncbi:30S ribosomal protein S16 [Candidatus Woesebacteria bacterium RIFCSPHIGHO2_01_FULL_41_10]|uniref:30S ribosomal protein S16 n=1 Tax=Candidatus Woesebacteria bacterium RIFCSPHIGHO2_01_FULL_41_10 TaxID=1802500 RepID=A0A1F7YPM1_9BACT|nr:MAG: 30S ribosomal protein S16 [Candidatus Woesebacteria bacterium RIFCSPHIGHO2_01_FULL_41_10]